MTMEGWGEGNDGLMKKKEGGGEREGEWGRVGERNRGRESGREE